jgi:hypothetical protein
MVEVMGADGVRHQFPYGTPQSVINQVTGQQPAPAAPSQATGTRPMFNGPAGSFLNGVSMGWMPKGVAAVRSAMDPRPSGSTLSSLITGQPAPGSYEDYLKAERMGQSKYQAENPIASGAAEFAGGIVPGVAATLATGGFGAPAAAATTAARAAPLMTRIGQALTPALYGGVQGAIQGAGNSEAKTYGGMASDAALGGGVGAVLGQTIAGGAKLAKMGWDKAALKFGWKDPTNASNIAIAEALQKDGQSPQAAQATLQALGKGDITLADVGENTRKLLSTATQAGGPTRNTAVDFLANRHASVVPRVNDDLKQVLSGANDFYGGLEAVRAARNANAKPMYDAAWQSGTRIDLSNPQSYAAAGGEHLPDLLSKPDFQKAMQVASRNMANDPTPSTFGQNPIYSLHQTKMALDDMINAETNPMTKEVTVAGRNLVDMKNKLLTDLNKISPEYNAARAAYAGDTDWINAGKAGQDIYKMSEPEIKSMVLKNVNNPSQMDSMRSGIAQAMLEKLRNSPDSDPLRTVLGGDAGRKIKLAFQDDAAYQEFVRRLQTEAQMMKTGKTGIKGAPTESAQESDKFSNGLSVAGDLATGKVGFGTVRNMLDTMAPAMKGMPESVAKPTAEKLLTPLGQQGNGLDSITTGILGSLKDQEDSLRKFGLNGMLGKGSAAAGAGAQAGLQSPSMNGGFPEGEEQQAAPPSPLAQVSAEQAQSQAPAPPPQQ